jgi:hypothetical protein
VDDSTLGQVVDPEELDRSAGPRGRMRVEVPAALLAAGGEIEITVPARVACARCDGGGCDGCERSGALRAPEPAEERRVRLTLPAQEPGAAAPARVELRLVRPLGDACLIEQLLVEVAAGDETSAGLVVVTPAGALVERAAGRRPSRVALVVAVAVAILLVIAALTGR